MKKNYDEPCRRKACGSRRLWFAGLLLLMAMLPGVRAVAQDVKATPKVTLNVKDATVTDVFQAIKAQTDFSLVYNVSDIDLSRKVTISATNESLPTVLDRLFAGTNVGYTIKDTHIVLSIQQQSQAKTSRSTVVGKVVGPAGDPLAGASVGVVGSAAGGVVTDMDGAFTIMASKGETLEISYMGYKKMRVAVTGAPISVTMADEAITTDAVVVTALGIKREARSLTYNAQQVAGAATTRVKDASFINSLAGKLAGVQISQSSSGVGGSTRVVMRGVKSMFGDNNALYVIDGIPMASLKSTQPNSGYESPDGGDGDGISDINPEDIESMTVMTGASASALYGYMGGNGVILIATKRGRMGDTKVTYTNSTSFQSPFVTPKFQNTYGSDPGSFRSWGQKLTTPTSYDPIDFFQTGYEEFNGVGVTTGNDRGQTYVSIGSTNARDIIPMTGYNRYNVTYRQTVDLARNLKLDLNTMYIVQDRKNPNPNGLYHNPLLPIYLFPRGDDIDKYKLYERYNPERNFATQFWPYGDQGLGMENPYWIINRDTFQVNRNRFVGTANLSWKIADGISMSGRWNYDWSQKSYQRKISASSNTLFASDCGDYLKTVTQFTSMYGDAILNIDKKIGNCFSITGNLGGSYQDYRANMVGGEGHLNMVPDYFNLTNINIFAAEAGPKQSDTHSQIQSVFGTVNLGYKRMAYLDLTARNDWCSQLAFTPKMSLFYPSAGASLLFNEMFNLSGAKISYLKLRGSYAEVGTPPDPYKTSDSHFINGYSNPETASAPVAANLNPERTKSFEAGISLKMFHNALSLDLTAYKANTYNQLFTVDANPGSGYSSFYINAGNVQNKGIELQLGYNTHFGRVDWTSTFNYAINQNRIIQLVPDGTKDPSGNDVEQTEFIASQYGSYMMKLTKGGSTGDIYVTGLKTDYDGYIKVDPQSGAVAADDKVWYFAGNANPRYTMGWENRFAYKGVELAFLIDARIGGVGVSATQALMDAYGVSQTSAIARDNGGAVVNGGKVSAQYYYAVVGGGINGILSHYVYDATNVRLRELSVGYTLPQKWLWGAFDQLTVSLTGRNLFMFYNKAPYDPTVTASTGTYYQGYDYFMVPSTRSLGFSVKVQF